MDDHHSSLHVPNLTNGTVCFIFKAYLCLGELFPSVNAAEKAVEMMPCWWMAYQTLGRAHLGLGEVRLVSIY